MICRECKIDKPETEYYRRSDNGKMKKICKECDKKYAKKWRQDNPEKREEYDKKWKQNNPEYYYDEKWKEYHKKWYLDNRDECGRKGKEWEKNNPGRYGKYKKDRCANDLIYRITCNIKVRVQRAIKYNIFNAKKSDRTMKLLGCTGVELKLYLESKFLPEMTWENYGRNGWHIDHIKPCASFDLSNPEEQRKCFHYTNLQPLWACDNIRKGKKYD